MFSFCYSRESHGKIAHRYTDTLSLSRLSYAVQVHYGKYEQFYFMSNCKHTVYVV